MYYGTPPIVTNGLVLNLDAANTKSLPAPPSTNLFTYSQDFSQAIWGKGGSTVTSTTASAPDGTSTACVLDDTNASSTPGVTNAPFIATSSTITYSIYTKRGTATSRTFLLRNQTTLTNFTAINFQYSISSSAAGWTVADAGNGWFRLSYTQTTGITPGNSMFAYYGRADGAVVGATDTWQVWGAQAEPTPYVTPYIPTTTTSVSRNTWSDLSGNIRTATLIASSTTSSRIPVFESLTSKNLSFDGIGSRATIGTGSSYPFPYHTYEIWAKTPGTGSTMVDGGGLMAFDYGRLITLDSLGRLRYVQTSGSSVVLFSRTTTQTFFDDKWHHIVCSRGVSQSEMYVDGILINSGSSGTAPGWDGLNSWSTMQAYLGDNPNDVTYKFRGSIASARVYNRQLTQAEVTQNYNALKSRFALS
jgi:hypothetical protein